MIPRERLNALKLDAFLPHEVPPSRIAARWVAGECYTPDGAPMNGVRAAQIWDAIASMASDPDNHRRTELQDGAVAVSTVYLGLNHGWDWTPVLTWETMVFGGPTDQWRALYSTRAAAFAGHTRVVAELADILGVAPPNDLPIVSVSAVEQFGSSAGS